MTSATPRLSRVFFAATAAFVLAAPAAAAPAFLKLGGVDGSTKAKDNHKDEIEILSYTWGESQESKVNKVDSFTVKQGAVPSDSGEKGGTQDINIGVGESLTPGGGVKPALAIGHEVQSPRDTASGQATGKRMHKPLRITRPLDQGSVSLKLKSGWADCRVGMRLPSLEIGGGGQSYVLQDVTVASCGSASGAADDRPTEEVAFYYNKIAFNYAATPDAR